MGRHDRENDDLAMVYAQVPQVPLGTRSTAKELALIKAALPPKRLRQYEAVEKIGLEELPVVTKLLAKVKRKGGVYDRIFITPDPIQTLSGRTAFVGMNFGGELIYGPGVTKYFSPEALSGVLAHELGHHVNGDPAKKKELLSPYVSALTDADEVKHLAEQFNPIFREQEFAADMFAASIGYGRELIEALLRSAREERFWSLYDPGNGTHPNVYDRIERLREYNERERMAA